MAEEESEAWNRGWKACEGSHIDQIARELFIYGSLFATQDPAFCYKEAERFMAYRLDRVKAVIR